MYTSWNPVTQKFTDVYDLEDCFRAIRTRNDDNEETIRRLRERVKSLESKHYKDEEIQRMQSELEKMRKELNAGFRITDAQRGNIDAWKRMHEEKVHGLTDDSERRKAQGISGGRYTYLFTPTSIGTFGSIKCVCGEEYCFCEP